ncbi:MAG: ATP-dependent DNA helicase RecG [Dehalococcoidia bacterium]|nr:ATP-dependent DNA helicase RecG [Dehalococcoidia bacterium]
MPLDVATLRKILELERKRGYEDGAVIGGLDRYLQRWGSEFPDSLLPASYASLDKRQRGEWLKKALHWLDGMEVEGQRVPAPSAKMDKNLDEPITTIKGISTNLAIKFRRLGVQTVCDLLYFFPRRHIDYSKRKTIAELEVGKEQTIVATVWQAQEATLGGRRSTEAIVGDETGNMRVVWFNQPYLAKKLRTNSQLVLSGRVSLFRGLKVFLSPEHEPLVSENLTHTGRLIPLYPLTEGLSPRVVRKLVKETVELWAPHLPDFLPEGVRSRAQLLDLPEAIKQAHYPKNEALKDSARKRLAFDELFLIQLGVLSRRRDWREGGEANPIKPEGEVLEAFLCSLPFALTRAQQRALEEILADLAKVRPMSRLLQGEVGSGKTVVATAALLATVASGYQGAFMAPTEILAEQHFPNISALLARAGREEKVEGSLRTFSSILPHPINMALLIGSMKQNEKERVHRAIAEGEVDIVVGTHALIQQDVDFERLGLAIVDEQHRFGVMQRSALRQKGGSPHLLVMTATPIPRSLALTLYGDLDLSVIDELPPGRQQISTRLLEPEERDKAYHFLRQQVEKGRQGFIICPLIEESEAIEAKAATNEYERLSRDVFPDLRLGLVHGRLKSSEKEEVMRRFRGGELDILVATPVVEVGIDVPNATVMLIEGADRFGLAQLHQFRGRVGRGEQQSYCILVAESPSPEGRERLSLLERTQDGFALAEEDLRLRGPGEFFGTRQSGLPDLKMAKLSDIALLEIARREAIRLFKEDPDLSRLEHQPLAREVARLWQDGIGGVEA